MTPDIQDWLKPLIAAVVREVVSEVGQGTPPQLYDVEAAARLLSVPPRWIYERTAAGTIPHVKLGKYIRFTDADLRQIIEKTFGKEPEG